MVFQATVTTMTASFGGGLVSIVLSYFQSGGKIEVLAAINGVLGSLVGVTGKNSTLDLNTSIYELKQKILNSTPFGSVQCLRRPQP